MKQTRTRTTVTDLYHLYNNIGMNGGILKDNLQPRPLTASLLLLHKIEKTVAILCWHKISTVLSIPAALHLIMRQTILLAVYLDAKYKNVCSMQNKTNTY